MDGNSTYPQEITYQSLFIISMMHNLCEHPEE